MVLKAPFKGEKLLLNEYDILPVRFRFSKDFEGSATIERVLFFQFDSLIKWLTASGSSMVEINYRLA